LALSVDVLGSATLAKIRKSSPIMTSPTKKQNPKLSNIFSV